MQELLALLFGAVIIVFFAYERFNGPGYEGSQQFERLVAYLTPDRLRARRVILRAYIFYALTLVGMHLFLCTYAQVLPLLGATGIPLDTVGASDIGAQEAVAGTQTHRGIGIAPSVSLTVALIMVGLAPSFPILQRFERWMISTAHRLAGIPTRVIEVAENLRHSRLAFEMMGADAVPSDTLLIRRGDWRRMAQYYKAAKDSLAEPEDFRSDLEIIFAVQAWILNRKLKLVGTQDRLRLQPLEAALRKRAEALIDALDEKSGNAPQGPQQGPRAGAVPVAADAPPEGVGHSPAGWERLAREADDLADDLCILLALYLEHEIIPSGSHAAPRPVTDAPGEAAPKPYASFRQHELAMARLQGFLGIGGDRSAGSAPQSYIVVTWLWTLGVVMAVCVIWSQWPGRFEAEMQGDSGTSGYLRILKYAFMGFSSYCIPMIVALAFRDSGLQLHRWNNLWSAHWTHTMPQAVVVVLASWTAATFILIASITWFASFSPQGLEDPWAYMGFQFEYMAPTTFRGAVLALLVMMMLDAERARARSLRLRSTWVSSLLWATSAAVIMTLIGGATRYLSAWAAALRFNRDGLDEIDRGLIVYAALSSALIGFFVMLCVTQALLNSRTGAVRRRGIRGGQPSPERPSVPAE